MPDIISLTSLTAGTDEFAGYGQGYGFYFSNIWAVGDTWSLAVSSTSGDFNFGAGPITGVVPSTSLALNQRLYFVSGSTLYGSALDDCTQWDVQTPSAFNIDLTNRTNQFNDYVGLASYQGRLAVFSPNTTQIWSLNADPALVVKTQDLENVGTEFPLSIQPLGDLDVLFLHSSGVRSLQVINSSLNSSVIDVGTPIDRTVESALDTVTNVCSVVDPTSSRYLITLDTTTYVLSYHPAVKVTAWASYANTYAVTVGSTTTHVAFYPTKYVIKDGVIYCIGYTVNQSGVKTWSLFSYSGTDSSPITVETPFLDFKTPENIKRFESADFIATGSWTFKFLPDPWYASDSSAAETVINFSDNVSLGTGTKSTFDIGKIPISLRGTHLKIVATSTSPTATLSGIFINYTNEGPK